MTTTFRFISVALAFLCLLTSCYETTPPEKVKELVDQGYSITWTKQVGEYWDEFSAIKDKDHERLLINRKKVKRDQTLIEGTPNTVTFNKNGILVVLKKPNQE